MNRFPKAEALSVLTKEQVLTHLEAIRVEAGKAMTQDQYTAAGEKAIRLLPRLVALLSDPSEGAGCSGWKRMTDEARRMQANHLDTHEGDVYHAMQALIGRFGSKAHGWTGDDIGSLQAAQPVAWKIVDKNGKRATIYNHDLAAKLAEIGTTVTAMCELPQKDWFCTRESSHEGPCALWPNAAQPAASAAKAWLIEGAYSDGMTFRTVALDVKDCPPHETEVSRIVTPLYAAPTERGDYIDTLRTQQSEAVMPLIGNLLDQWEQMPNDVRELAPGLDEAISAIDVAMEGEENG